MDVQGLPFLPLLLLLLFLPRHSLSTVHQGSLAEGAANEEGEGEHQPAAVTKTGAQSVTQAEKEDDLKRMNTPAQLGGAEATEAQSGGVPQPEQRVNLFLGSSSRDKNEQWQRLHNDPLLGVGYFCSCPPCGIPGAILSG